MSVFRNISTSVLLATASIATVAIASPVAAQEKTIEIDIKRQPLQNALIELSRQADVVIVADPEAVRGRNAPAVRGRMTAKVALASLLAGSGLNSNRRADGSFTITGNAKGNGGVGAGSTNDGQIVVTGTRIPGVEPTSQTVVITREQIESRGYTSAEEILSSLPQAFGSFSSAATSAAGNGFDNGIDDPGVTAGQSAANLRGLGASNVLVLVNGRRKSVSSALALFTTDESLNATNLATIPFAAVERVEIILDGASAIYGADAVGGVINFILRDNYNGGELSAYYETGEAGGDEIQIAGVFGKTWGSGFLTLSGEYSHTDRVLSKDIGYTTDDRRQLSDDPLAFDQRFYGSPVAIYNEDFDFVGTLRPGDDGAPLTDADIDGTSGRLTLDPEARLISLIEPELFPESERWTINLGAEQELFEDFTVFVDGTYSSNRTTSRRRPIGGEVSFDFTVDAGTTFNASSQDLDIDGIVPFGVSDLLPDTFTVSKSERLSGAAGFEYDFTGGFINGWRARGSVGYDRSENNTRQTGALVFDVDRFEELVASGDINPFTDYSTQPALAQAVKDAEGIGTLGRPVQSELTQATLDFEGPLFALPGGTSRMAFGGELRWESLNLDETFLAGGDADLTFPLTSPTRDLIAVFGEINLPLVGSANDIPLIDSFEVNLAGRFDSYTAQSTSSIDGTPTTINNTYEEFSPRIGVAWRPVPSLKLRGNWQESFRAPSVRQLFIADQSIFTRAGGRFLDPSFFINIPFNDVFFPSDRASAPTWTLDSIANPNLKGESSESWSAGADWDVDFIRGLRLSVNYNHTKITDAFSSTQELLREDAAFLALGPDGLGTLTRDDNGYIIAIREQPLNIVSFTSETLDFFVDYQTSTPIGELGLIFNSSHILANERVLVEDADGVVPEVLRGTDRAPSNWQHFAEARLKTGSTTFVVTMNYIGEFTNVFNADSLANRVVRDRFSDVPYLFEQGEPFLIDVSNPDSVSDDTLVQEVDEFVTFDFVVQHKFDAAGLRLTLGAKNVFDAEPPYFASSERVPFSVSKHNPLGRRIFVKATKEF